VLVSTKLPTLRLEELVLRGDIVMNGAQYYSLEVLLNRKLFQFSQNLSKEAIQALEAIIRANGAMAYLKGGKDILVPNPRVAAVFLAKQDEARQVRVSLVQRAASTQQILDAMILDAYAITKPAWKELVEAGVPWAK